MSVRKEGSLKIKNFLQGGIGPKPSSEFWPPVPPWYYGSVLVAGNGGMVRFLFMALVIFGPDRPRRHAGLRAAIVGRGLQRTGGDLLLRLLHRADHVASHRPSHLRDHRHLGMKIAELQPVHRHVTRTCRHFTR
jgi:hypothetical protein